jgi:hypothetical protein
MFYTYFGIVVSLYEANQSFIYYYCLVVTMADIAIPSVLMVTLMLTTLTQLEDLGQQSADKTVKFATDATNAIDCAYQARPLTECSPDLLSTDFTAEIQESQRILEDLRSQQPGANLQTS